MALGFGFFSLLPSKDEPALQGYFAEQMTRDFNMWKPKEMLFAGDDLWQPTEQHDLAHFEPSVSPFRSKEQVSKISRSLTTEFMCVSTSQQNAIVPVAPSLFDVNLQTRSKA